MSPSTAVERSERAVALMMSPSSYREDTSSIEVIETHISWVFLTVRHAYKLKKPVRFEFLDFSTPELRHRACLTELRLNRRLAPDIYLGVLPITQDLDGSLALGGYGQEIDWVVEMRRLPAEKALDVILRKESLSPNDAIELAQYLAHFYSRLPAQALPPREYRLVLEQHIRANGAALLDALPEEHAIVRRIQSAQLRFLNIEAELIDKRATAGHVVDGHGDLRPEHIYLDSPPAIIDCIEFSDELRRVDIADELSFLAMECERLGDGGLGGHILEAYERISGDAIPARLLAFYRSYRACVRAKVSVLQRQQRAKNQNESDNDLTRQYLDLADRYAAKLGSPALLMVGGLMGTGKSTLAGRLADAFGAELISTDRIRRKMLGASTQPAEYGEDRYRPEIRRHIYNELLREAENFLSQRRLVILDGTFLKKSLREQAHALSLRHGAKCLYIQCICPRPTAFARIRHRAENAQSESEARTELYDLQARDFEPPSADEAVVFVDTAEPTAHQLRRVCNELRRLLFG